MVARALEHANPTLFLQLACAKFRREHIVRPGMPRGERLVATARPQAHEDTCQRLTSLLPRERTPVLDDWLPPDATTHRTRLSWLRQEATAHAAPQSGETVKKIRFLQDAGVPQWALTRLNPNRVKWRAQLGGRATHQQVQRTPPVRRYPILIAFLYQALLHHTDVVVALYAQGLWEYHRSARHERDQFRKASARSTNEQRRLFREVGEVRLDAQIADAAVRSVSFQRVPKAEWQTALTDTQRLSRPRPDAAIDFFGKRSSSGRQLAPAFRQTLTVRGQGPKETVLRAVNVLRALDRLPVRRPVPRTAPLALVPDAWRPSSREPEGGSSRRY